jgi:hypothetical protein
MYNKVTKLKRSQFVVEREGLPRIFLKNIQGTDHAKDTESSADDGAKNFQGRKSRHSENLQVLSEGERTLEFLCFNMITTQENNGNIYMIETVPQLRLPQPWAVCSSFHVKKASDLRKTISDKHDAQKLVAELQGFKSANLKFLCNKLQESLFWFSLDAI